MSVMRYFLAAQVFLLTLVDVASAAPPVCDRRELIVASLTEQYGESARSIGLDTRGNLLEIFASPEGSWTAILTDPRGKACVVATGEAFEQVNLPSSTI
jgi:hypothetical protein